MKKVYMLFFLTVWVVSGVENFLNGTSLGVCIVSGFFVAAIVCFVVCFGLNSSIILEERSKMDRDKV